ncbi:MAG: hypothetical protein PHC28_00085 [Flavobacterium sp.]|uniref:hypothetical protein n=1 Tax=Flavobacterium sp. TaxID=239 RepID=UPI002629306B|nr:hypothetical protein [Flavobacterium sp.]MDD5148865.1 hypothetical protein [Flavobacterium sp.]
MIQKVTSQIQMFLMSQFNISKDFKNCLNALKEMDWSKLKLKVFAVQGTGVAIAKVFLLEGE